MSMDLRTILNDEEQANKMVELPDLDVEIHV